MKELNRTELAEINGGNIIIPKWFKTSIWGMAAIYVIDHWDDFKSGIVDGYTDGAKSN
jgi:bacteriocin-like protein